MSSDNYFDHTYVLILAGGGGTRLWPYSRRKSPKQFLKLLSEKTLFQETVDRLDEEFSYNRIFCITVSEESKKEILKEVPKFKPENIIVEPFMRDTGPAHSLGALYIYKKDPNAVIINEASDRKETPKSDYIKVLKRCAKLAYEEKKIIAVGVKPRYPHPGLGDIIKGRKYTQIGDTNFFQVNKFLEKKPVSYIKRYLSPNRYFWNAGQYVWRADTLLGELKLYAPKIYTNLKKIQKSLGKSDESKVIRNVYKEMPKVSIDYAVSEKSKHMLVADAEFYWTDIGDWNEVWKIVNKDKYGNVVFGNGDNVTNIDSENTLVKTNGKHIAILGLENAIIVDTDDAILIANKEKSFDVKKIVSMLKKQKKDRLL